MMFQDYVTNENNNANVNICLEDIDNYLIKMKLVKALGFDGVMSEHLIHSRPIFILQISLLFQMMLMIHYVPNDFGKTIIIPLLKDVDGDTSSSDNNRVINFSLVVSRLFEFYLLIKLSTFLQSYL